MTPTITQADRDAAASLVALAELRPMLLSGSHDDHPYIHAFAAHREMGAHIVAWLAIESLREWERKKHRPVIRALVWDGHEVGEAVHCRPEWYWVGGNDVMHPQPTHWMPLPERPEHDEDGE